LGSKGTFVTVSLLLLAAAACIGYTFWSLGHRRSCVLLTAYFLFALGAIALLFRLTAFLKHYHAERNHQGLGNKIIEPGDEVGQIGGNIESCEQLGGILKYYYRDAA